MAEGGGLLNRYRVVKPYRGFESLRLRHRSALLASRALRIQRKPINARMHFFGSGWRRGEVTAGIANHVTIGPRDSVVRQPGDQLRHHHSGSWMDIVKKDKAAAPKQHQ